METTDSTCLLYKDIIGVQAPWEVTEVTKDEKIRKITVRIEHDSETAIKCPVCEQETKLYDHRIRTLRYLDTCQYETFLEVHVPRVSCKEDGVQQIPIPYAEKHSRFSSRFEKAIIVWLQDSPISAVAENFKLSWDEVDGIMQRAVKRGLSRRKKHKVKNMGIDETSYQKHHEYVTVILDKDRDSVIDVLDDRTAETLETWLKTQKSCNLSGLESISMDMWDPYIKAVKDNIPEAEQKIAFDRFHVSKHFNGALDKVRRREHKAFMKQAGESPLSKSRFQWLINSNRTDNRNTRRKDFLNLSRMNLETAKAWRIKETASSLWDYVYMNVAEAAWKKLLWWISHCRIPEIIKAGKTIKNYFWGILNAIRLKATNGMLEAKNNCIQRIKRMACGFRNRNRFRNAILFHLGKLDLFPSTV
uniref:Transposase n=1 Tax=uncultured bacterium contig00051 TaxID=1181535 RepID=A0A806KPG1_9BACT|nr:transposase [uncultured bacterium contig00051]